MRWAGLALSVVIVLISAVTLVVPDQRVAFEVSMMNRAGFGAIAAMRIVIALILIFAAPHSRTPRVVRAIGLIVLAAGLATPWFATERGQTIVNELVSAGSTVMRINAIVGLVLGVFLGVVLWP